jgi:DNA-binding beta-propeller fold protein YncE/mono/diheme cytochrome c family protein/cytochrome c553
VADEKGRSVYVANQLGGTVDEIDVETLSITRSFAVNGQPRFLALHPSGKHLYVGSTFGGILTDLDLKSGEVNELVIPENVGADPETFESLVFTPRITGDLSVSPDGTALAVPALYINNVTSVGAPTTDVDEPSTDGYAGGGPNGTRRFNPSVVLIVTNQDGKLRMDLSDTLLVTGFGRGDSIASYPSSAAFAPNGETVVLTLEGSDANLVVSVPDSIGDQSVGRSRGGREMTMDMAMEFGGSTLQFGDTETILVGSAPRGVAFLDDEQAFVHTGFDASVADMRFDEAASRIRERNEIRGTRGGRGVAEPMPMEDFGDFEGEDGFGFQGPDPVLSREPILVSADLLSPELAQGRAMFYSAANAQMALPGAAVSCATCHFDGRNDGLTWQFDEGARQTPSLAGEVSLTAPVTWVDDVETVLDEVMVTSQGRMGGDGLALEDAALVAAYVDSTPLPDTPDRRASTDAVKRGKELFESAEVGCADCHNGVAYTDNQPYEMFGLSNVRTRGLQGIAASAPYLHDGSAPTLRAVLVRAGDGEMGTTSHLSDAQLSDLEAYLKSL